MSIESQIETFRQDRTAARWTRYRSLVRASSKSDLTPEQVEDLDGLLVVLGISVTKAEGAREDLAEYDRLAPIVADKTLPDREAATRQTHQMWAEESARISRDAATKWSADQLKQSEARKAEGKDGLIASVPEEVFQGSIAHRQSRHAELVKEADEAWKAAKPWHAAWERFQFIGTKYAEFINAPAIGGGR